MDAVAVVPGLHWLRFAIGNAYVWGDADGVTLIDCGTPGSAAAIREALRGLGYAADDVRRVVLTHCHEDHVGGAAEIARWGAEVYAHRADAAVIRGEAAAPEPVLSDWERALLEHVRRDVPPVPPEPVRVVHELSGGEVLDFGGGARVIPVPGHTPGSIALHLPAAGVLFTGDAIARGRGGEVILGVFNADPDAARESFRAQAELAPATVCFGHGDPLTDHAADRLHAAALPGS